MTATVKNFWNVEFDYEVAENFMPEIEAMGDCTDQEFFDAYCVAHEERFGEEWELAKENPVF